MDAVADHGGSLGRAAALFPHAPLPWIDLSTGINPHSYPLFDLPATALSRLPEPVRARELAAVAAAVYGAPSAANVVPAPGTQILLPRVAASVKPGRALVLGPTYAEHARACAIAGHTVAEVRDFDALFGADIAVVVNPNNPDGRVVSRQNLLELADKMRAKGGLLVVDEAFMDVGPADERVDGDVGRGGLVVLRSLENSLAWPAYGWDLPLRTNRWPRAWTPNLAHGRWPGRRWNMASRRLPTRIGSARCVIGWTRRRRGWIPCLPVSARLSVVAPACSVF